MRHSSQSRTYGVLVGDVKDGQLDPTGQTPHYEIWVKARGVSYRVAVNVISQDGSEVMAYLDHNYASPNSKKLDLARLANGDAGFMALKTGNSGQGIDYLRDKLFPMDRMSAIPPEGSGISLKNLLDGQIERAKADPEAVLILAFGFSPERGVHDIHMMQGDSGKHASDNRAHGDGALFLRFTGGETVALFVRFESQDISVRARSSKSAGKRKPPQKTRPARKASPARTKRR
jgi:uncharacterized protein YukJ